jgi:hypothetical protein
LKQPVLNLFCDKGFTVFGAKGEMHIHL